MDFGSLITAPLNACVDAQAQAATATAEYIHKVGFQYDEKKKVYMPVTCTFSYTTDNEDIEKQITIPLISVVPIPYLQIHDINLDFSTELTVEDGYHLVGKVSTRKKGLVTTKETTEETSSYKSDLKVDVNIKASTADMPMGVSQLLRVMQNLITMKTIEP